MMTLKNKLAYLPLAAFLLTCPTAEARANERELPFHGSVPGAEESQQAFPDFSVQGDGTGVLSLMGLVTATWDREGSLIDGSQTASYEFVAANGDRLFAESVGQADLLQLPNIHVIETATVTGGTGRFEGATGTFLIERIVVITGPDTTITSQEIDGFIVVHHGK